MAKTILQQKFRSIQNCPIPRSWDLRIARADTTKLGWMLRCIRGISDFALVLPTFYAHNEASLSQFSVEVLPTRKHLPLSLWLVCSCHSVSSKHTHFLSYFTATSRISFLFAAPTQYCQLLLQGTKRQHCYSQCSKLNPQPSVQPSLSTGRNTAPHPAGEGYERGWMKSASSLALISKREEEGSNLPAGFKFKCKVPSKRRTAQGN